MSATQGKRHRAREMAIQMLYQLDMGQSPLPHVFGHFDPVPFEDSDDEAASGDEVTSAEEEPLARSSSFAYARTLVEGTVTHGEEIDELIRKQAVNWRLERMSAVDRNILRLAIYELLYESDVPKVVIIDEAIELAKRFGAEDSSRFVNGLLDGLLKKGKAQPAGKGKA